VQLKLPNRMMPPISIGVAPPGRPHACGCLGASPATPRAIGCTATNASDCKVPTGVLNDPDVVRELAPRTASAATGFKHAAIRCGHAGHPTQAFAGSPVPQLDGHR
jgi:hypothetical protein